MRNSSAAGNTARNLSRPLCHRRAITGETGKPSRASSIAGRSSCSNGNLPKRRDSSAQAAGQPGTVTGVQPYSGIRSAGGAHPLAIEPGARPLASRPCRRPRVQTRAKASPPIPQPVGSTTVSAAAAAIAASMALPPRRNISNPTCAACGDGDHAAAGMDRRTLRGVGSAWAEKSSIGGLRET